MTMFPRGLALLALAFAAVSCSLADFYDDKEYVLYDSTTPAATGSDERAEQDRIAAEASATDAEPGAEADVGGVGRIFVLENLRDELDRALRDGVGDTAALERKREDVDREIRWRVEAAGEAYVEARRERLDRLMGFPVVVR